MLSIGEMAHLTGVSRRMLRHWEDVGVVTPASVDRDTGYRWYARSQVGRVRAIASLRSVGFSLAEVRDLLDHTQLTEDRLLGILVARERDLTTQIAEASARLVEVRQRLDGIQRGHHTIMSTLELTALPSLRLLCLQETVADESEIGAALADLLPRFRDAVRGRGADGDTVVTYDGTSDADAIVVTVGRTVIDDDVVRRGLCVRHVDGSGRGVTVRFDTAPQDVGDAWISLDASLEPHGLETTGVYRQTLLRDGAVVLQAPVRQRSAP